MMWRCVVRWANGLPTTARVDRAAYRQLCQIYRADLYERVIRGGVICER